MAQFELERTHRTLTAPTPTPDSTPSSAGAGRHVSLELDDEYWRKKKGEFGFPSRDVGTYCFNLGFNYPEYPGARARYPGRARARIGAVLGLKFPCDERMRSVEGIGLELATGEVGALSCLGGYSSKIK